MAAVIDTVDFAEYFDAIREALAGEGAFCFNPYWDGAGRGAAREAVERLSAGGAGAGCVRVPTGGTGGRIRFVTHNRETLEAAARAQLDALGAGCADMVSPLPPWHISGLMPLIRAEVCGGGFWHCPGHFRPDEPLPELPSSHGGFGGAATVSLVPTQLYRLLERPDGGGVSWLRRFDSILLGGAKMPPELTARIAELGLPVFVGYGMTETAAFVAAQEPAALAAGGAPSGKILAHAQIRICDEAGRVLPEGKRGRIVIAASSLGVGEGEVGADGVRRLFTNDEGELLGGRLRVCGRLDRFVVSGGEKVDPAAVEAVLGAVPWVRAVLVTGEADAEWGERVVALIELREARPGDWRERLDAVAREHLTRHCVPRRWLAVERLPFNENGKLVRAELARLLSGA